MKKIKIGFIGIGLMGFPMAKNILKSRYRVKVYNRTFYKAYNLKKYGAEVCRNIKDVVSKQDLIITMLADDKAINKIYFDDNFFKNIKKRCNRNRYELSKP